MWIFFLFLFKPGIIHHIKNCKLNISIQKYIFYLNQYNLWLHFRDFKLSYGSCWIEINLIQFIWYCLFETCLRAVNGRVTDPSLTDAKDPYNLSSLKSDLSNRPDNKLKSITMFSIRSRFNFQTTWWRSCCRSWKSYRSRLI